VEVAGPDEAEHRAREVADESHEDAEVRNAHGHEDRHQHQANPESTPASPQLFLLVVNRTERVTAEKYLLKEVSGRVIRQRIR